MSKSSKVTPLKIEYTTLLERARALPSPKKGPPCTVCASPLRAEVDEAIAAGLSPKKIAKVSNGAFKWWHVHAHRDADHHKEAN